MYGCLMALLINPLRAARRCETMSSLQWTLFLIGVSLLLFSLIYRNPVFRETLRYSLQGIALIPIFYFAILFHDNAIFRHLNSVWAIRIGVYSYVIYLVHQIIIFLVVRNAPLIASNSYVVFSIVLVISITYAAAIDSYVDPYFRRLRRKYKPGGGHRSPRVPNARKPPRAVHIP
jgi:peptidoglycan/LPS O-acetylase OafA/YrhL